MAKNKKTIFSINEKEYALVRPNFKQNEDATMEYNRVFSKALLNGALLREKLEQYMFDQGLWDNEREKTQNRLIQAIADKQRVLEKGGIKLSEAKNVAIDMKTLRLTLQTLIAEKNALDTNTAQGQAENARFNSLLVSCLVYNDTGDPVYNDVDEYLSAEDEVSVGAAENFANMYFGLDKNYESNLPENKFLQQFQFADKENRLINDSGRLIDYEGHLVNEEGRFIDEDGEYIDIDGNRVQEDGSLVVTFSPFLDEDGNPIANEETNETETPTKKTTKKRGRPKKSDAEKSKEEVS